LLKPQVDDPDYRHEVSAIRLAAMNINSHKHIVDSSDEVDQGVFLSINESFQECRHRRMPRGVRNLRQIPWSFQS
jgi:dUTPase